MGIEKTGALFNLAKEKSVINKATQISITLTTTFVLFIIRSAPQIPNSIYSEDYYHLAITTRKIAFSLDSYLESKNQSYLYRGMAFSECAQLQANIFGAYFKDQLGSELSSYFVNYYRKISKPIPQKKNTNEIKKDIQRLNKLTELMLPNGKFPEPREYRKNAEQLLNEVKKYIT